MEKCFFLETGKLSKEKDPLFRKKMDALDPQKNKIYKFPGCRLVDKIDLKQVMERIKKEIRKRLNHVIELNLNYQNLMKAINYPVMPVAGYIMNLCNLVKGDLGELDMIVKIVLQRERFLEKQSSNEKLYLKKKEGGRALKGFKEVYG